MLIRLKIHQGTLAGTEIITGAPMVRIGRDPAKVDLVLEDEQISGRHCIVQRSPRGAYALEDLGSTNGTYVNDRRLANVGRPMAVYLTSGDRFRIGKTEIEALEGQARLILAAGPKSGAEWMLGDRLLTLGRAPDNQIVVDDPQASGYHGVIRTTPLGFCFEDHNSTNGSYINGHKASSKIFSDGDELAIGNYVFRFVVDDLEPKLAEASLHGAGEGLAFLQFVSGSMNGQKLTLGEGQWILGRRPDVSFVLSDDQISGAHCAITCTGTSFVVTDLRSTNGTFVNGQRLTQGQNLLHGDLIALGNNVAEFKMSGGKAAVGNMTALHTVMAEGAYQLSAQPKFVVNGQVISSKQITLGSGTRCDLRVDGSGVAKEHCIIGWKDGFYVEDTSSTGTYVNDRRVVREPLSGNVVVRLGDAQVQISVRGERCQIDSIDIAQAVAAVQVAREFASRLHGADLSRASGADDGRFASLSAGYKTVFQMDHVDADAMVRERKQKIHKGAPAWRPSLDIKSDKIAKTAVISAALAAILIGGLLTFRADAQALMNHPLSEAHRSPAFAAEVSAQGLSSDCRACHTLGEGVSKATCGGCHATQGEHLRVAHASNDAKAVPGADCEKCHREHQNAPRFVVANIPSYLGAGDSCTQSGCHVDQHKNDFLDKSAAPNGFVLKASPVKNFRLPQKEFHVAHAVVDVNGHPTAVGCNACHGTTNKEGVVVAGVPGKSCFRCHEGGQEHVAGACAACHTDEHEGAVAIARVAEPTGGNNASSDPGFASFEAGSAIRSLAWSGAFAFVAFTPLLLAAFVRRSRRRERIAVLVGEMAAHPSEMVKRLIHSINQDKCVGCAMCVQACPGSVLELVNHKSHVVNFDSCIQCKRCEEVCAFDALRMHDADKPPPMVSFPDVDANYETPVKGMYLIGQAAGTPQVKNASNLGRAVLEHAQSHGLVPGLGASVGAQFDCLVIGSGPAGLSAALSCQEKGLSYALLEKERQFSWTVRNYFHKGKEVMAEPSNVELVGLLPHWDTTREDLLENWERIIIDRKLRLELSCNVTGIVKQGEMFAVTFTHPTSGTQTWTCARVVVAIGTMGNPRKLGCPGEDLEKVKNSLVDPDEWRGKNVLVVGGTDSAIEVVLALCETNTVWLSCRGAKFDRVKPKNLKLFEDVVAAGKCHTRFATAIKEVVEGKITLEHKQENRLEDLPNDVVFGMIGGAPPVKWLQSIGVPYVDKPHSWSPPRTDELVRSWMNLAPRA